MCVPNRVEQLRAFPRYAAESGFVYYVKKGKRGQRKFKVRPHKVRTLFNYLETYNPAYINAKAAGERPTLWDDERARDTFGEGWEARRADHTVSLDVPTLEHEGEEVADDTGPAASQYPAPSADGETASGFVNALPVADVQATIDAALEKACSQSGRAAPGQCGTPAASPVEPVFRLTSDEGAISEFDPDFFSMAFPEIFFNGYADLKERGEDVDYPSREVPLDLAEWLEHILWQGDCRASRHRVFCFVAFSMLQRHRAMKQGSFFVSDRMKDSRGSDGLPLSLEELRQKLAEGDQSLARSIFFWGENIRGSDAYMGKMKPSLPSAVLVRPMISPSARL